MGCHFLLQCMKVKVKSLSRVRLLETPWTAAYQAPLLDVFKYLIFLNLSHCPVSFALKVKVTRSSPTLCDFMDLVHGILQARMLEWVSLFHSLGDLPNPGIEPGTPTLQADFFTS